jgi:hypothetical protein
VADPYVYPGTDVLRNLAGLRYADTLADREPRQMQAPAFRAKQQRGGT